MNYFIEPKNMIAYIKQQLGDNHTPIQLYSALYLNYAYYLATYSELSDPKYKHKLFNATFETSYYTPMMTGYSHHHHPIYLDTEPDNLVFVEQLTNEIKNNIQAFIDNITSQIKLLSDFECVDMMLEDEVFLKYRDSSLSNNQNTKMPDVEIKDEYIKRVNQNQEL